MTDKQKTNPPDFTCQARPTTHRPPLMRADDAPPPADTDIFRHV
jgi:hypothetical protein